MFSLVYRNWNKTNEEVFFLKIREGHKWSLFCFYWVGVLTTTPVVPILFFSFCLLFVDSALWLHC
ncbi:MAG: hypothetical protein B7X84_03600 [Alphaproteobacteria bacterium 17-39-52]|nr:MAG: hypothetical protein B7X84_03600 [Alphaproteobacteria bacterium 17-39-52]